MKLLCCLAYFLALVLTGSVVSCTEQPETQEDQLGSLDFIVSGSDEAQPHFRKGLLLLHSFEFTDAAEAFQKARELDPDFVMAYWGEAMTHNHPLWRYQNKVKADSLLNLLATTPEERIARAETELEKDFLRAAHVLYGDGSKTQRDSAYADFMASLYRKYPGHNEVASFYGLALLGSVPVGRDVETYEKAARIAKEVLDRNPEHPGALHYLIHAYDDPGHASLALGAADAYAKIAPDAGHALHMPSHIYLASGLWDKVISSNEDAWQAGVDRVRRKDLTHDDLNYHAFHWLAYGYLQDGREDDALRVVEHMRNYRDSLASPRAREHLILLKTTWLVESENYTHAIADLSVDDDDLNISTRALHDFTQGMNAWVRKDASTLDSLIVRMDAERLRAAELSSGGTARTCAVVSGLPSNLLDRQQAEVMALQLKAMSADLHGDMTTAEKFLRQATDLESSISYAYGPPTIVKPSWEMYADWLVGHKRYAEAIPLYDETLKVHPARRLALTRREEALSNS